MKRSATVSQNVRVLVTAAALAVGAIGCGSKGNDTTGAGGAGGGAVCTLAEVNAIFQPTATTGAYTGCTVIGACHDNAGSAAGLDLTSADWPTKLVAMGPVAGKGASTTLNSLCAGMGLIYLNKGSNPATGLFIDKLRINATVPCGVHMPNLGAMLSATQFACVQSYATTLTTAP
jgi:hypothetical protein